MAAMLWADQLRRERAPAGDGGRPNPFAAHWSYWMLMLAAGVLGTALGDWLAEDLGLGVYWASTIGFPLFAGAVWAAYRFRTRQALALARHRGVPDLGNGPRRHACRHVPLRRLQTGSALDQHGADWRACLPASSPCGRIAAGPSRRRRRRRPADQYSHQPQQKPRRRERRRGETNALEINKRRRERPADGPGGGHATDGPKPASLQPTRGAFVPPFSRFARLSAADLKRGWRGERRRVTTSPGTGSTKD